jgi:hypothetical protein
MGRLVKAEIRGYPRATFLCGGNPRIKKRQDRGTPTQVTCRGAPRGYPKIYANYYYFHTGARCEYVQ